MRMKKFKGISPVIATILMVMITVGLVAFSYSWFMSMGERAKIGSETALTEITESQAYLTFDILYCETDRLIGTLRGHMGNINMNETNAYFVDRDGSITTLDNADFEPSSEGEFCFNQTNLVLLEPGRVCTFEIDDATTCGTDCSCGCSSGAAIKMVIGNGRSASNNIAGCQA